MTNLPNTHTTKARHKHIWKYDGSNVRVCESPIPTIKSCGKEEWRTMFNGWVDAGEIIKESFENYQESMQDEIS